MTTVVAAEPAYSQAVADAVDYMRLNLGGEVTVDHLARVMRYSKWHATRMFAKETGFTPGRFLADLRMQRSAALIMEGAKVSDVCHQVGYSSIGTFSAKFTVYWGVPATQYVRSRCPCGMFGGRSHSTPKWCRAPEGELCTRCHQCLEVREKEGTQGETMNKVPTHLNGRVDSWL